jgi:hypothetical protein
MKKLTTKAKSTANCDLEYYVSNILIAHEKDWQTIIKLVQLEAKKAKR